MTKLVLNTLVVFCGQFGLFEILFLLVELLIINGSLLVLLVLGHQIVHVGLGLSELHLVHALACERIKGLSTQSLSATPHLCTNEGKPSS